MKYIHTFESFLDEGELYDVKKKVKAGKMHKLLGVPEDKEITDVYTDPKKLAEDLVKATGDKKEAAGMLAFAANINPKENIFDKALRVMPDVEESGRYMSYAEVKNMR
jgi:hypothetical protein